MRAQAPVSPFSIAIILVPLAPSPLPPPQVIIGQKKGQTTRVLSRCLWDAKADNVAVVNYENKEMYAVLQVFGLYHE